MRIAVRLLSLSLLVSLGICVFAQETPPQKPPPSRETTSQGQDQAQDGVEVQARGQVHEAFASPSLGRQEAAPVINKKPPEPVNELPPDQKPEGDNVRWIPGYWMWEDERSDFVWVSGTWRNIPPDRRWIPGYWVAADNGHRWVSGYWMDQDETQVTLLPEPPERVAEAAPSYDQATETYVPGTWIYHENRYAWRPGYRIANNPGWIWIPASYRWTPGGYIFVDGYWDYDLSRRGLVFAPVYITHRGGDWTYRPRYVLGIDFLQGALFVNTGWNHYYFGDYYDARYARLGYQPWISYRYYDRYYDPLFTYYRWQNRNDGRWQTNLTNLYTGRRDGSVQRPARTFAELNRTTASGQPAAIVAIDRWKGDGIKLETFKQDNSRAAVDHYRTLSTQRGKNEVNKRTSGSIDPGTSKTGSNNPPAKTDTPPAKTDTPPAKTDAPPPKTGTDSPATGTSPANRYEIPKNDRNFQRGDGKMEAPKRPTQPPVQQNNPGRGENPGKSGGGAPGKSGGSPGKKGG